MTPQMERMVKKMKDKHILIFPTCNRKAFDEDSFSRNITAAGTTELIFWWNDEEGNTYIDKEVEEKLQAAFCGALDAICKYQNSLRCNDATDKCQYKHYTDINRW